MVLQPRDTHLLSEIGTMQVIDREQSKIVAGFGSTSRANARLSALVKAGLLRRYYWGTRRGGSKAIYGLSAKGARLVGAAIRDPRHRKDEILVGEYFFEHQLAINRVYCALKYSSATVDPEYAVTWKTILEPIAPGLLPDGYVEMKFRGIHLAAFLEVDLGSEALSTWAAKVRAYVLYAASGNAEQRFQQKRFRVLALANSKSRVDSLRQATAGITDKIFWFATLESSLKDFCGPIWHRPTGNVPRQLFDLPQ